MTTRRKPAKSGELMAWSPSKADIVKFVSSARNQAIIGPMVARREKGSEETHPSLKTVWTARVK